jgi:hypothetical protein
VDELQLFAHLGQYPKASLLVPTDTTGPELDIRLASQSGGPRMTRTDHAVVRGGGAGEGDGLEFLTQHFHPSP